jgi:hypothetical protein
MQRAVEQIRRMRGGAQSHLTERHQFVREALRDVGAEAVPLEGLAVWTAKMRPLIQ